MRLTPKRSTRAQEGIASRALRLSPVLWTVWYASYTIQGRSTPGAAFEKRWPMRG
jgi:hypothetical protein